METVKKELGFGQIGLRVISCVPKQTQAKDGKPSHPYFMLYLQVPSGEVGELYSSTQHKPDDIIPMSIYVHDGDFVCRRVRE